MGPDGAARAGGVGGSEVVGLIPRRELSGRVGAARVTVVSAPAGSGKTVLLRSWMAESGVGARVVWVPVQRHEGDPRRFWSAVVDALHAGTEGPARSAAPDLDGWTLVERLLEELTPVDEPMWLVIDDVDELDPAETLRQLELLVLRAPAAVRFVLATRRDLRLGLHRLRLHGELTEIRVADLRFSPGEARELFAAAGVEVPEAALSVLYERTEGWAAGLRLAALSLAGHPDLDRFAREFSGSERTVAEYLLAEVLDRQSPQVRRMLLRTSLLERVNGELADLLSGAGGGCGERVLHELAHANAFVTVSEATRPWFRYHRLFADLLQLELRRTAPGEIADLHRAAAGWLAAHGCAVEAIRHAQAAQDWGVAARLLADRWPGLLMDGETGTIHELLAGFPVALRTTDGELALLAAADELRYTPGKPKEHYLGLAVGAVTSVPVERQPHAQLVFGIVRLLVARDHWDLPAAAEAAQQLRCAADAPDVSLRGLGADLHALALVTLGTTEYSLARYEDAVRHLELGAAIARQIGRPYLEFTSLAYQAAAAMFGSLVPVAELAERAMHLARRHGWTEEPAAGIAATALATVLVWRGRMAAAESWHERAERTLRAAAEPTVTMTIRCSQGILALARGRCPDALTAFECAERAAGGLAVHSPFVTILRGFRLLTLVRMGETGRAAAAFAALEAEARECAWVRLAAATLRIAEGAPAAALLALAPVLDGSLPVMWPGRLTEGFLLAAIAHEALDDSEAAAAAVERALDIAAPEGVVLWFLLYPVHDLLERRAEHGSGHAALIAEVRTLSTGYAAVPACPRAPSEPLSDSEIRVLRYLPTHLSAPDIARELSVSPNTVKTHMRNVYTKLGVHRRAEAVGHARALGLLAPALGR